MVVVIGLRLMVGGVVNVGKRTIVVVNERYIVRGMGVIVGGIAHRSNVIWIIIVEYGVCFFIV